jgi:hypothetical protein
MKKSLLLLTVITLALTAGYWAVEHGKPHSDQLNYADFGATPNTGNSGRPTPSLGPNAAALLGQKLREEDGSSATLPRSSDQPADDDRQAQAEVRAFNLLDPFDREQLAEYMRHTGSSEEEIEAIFQSSPAHPFSEADGRSFTLQPTATEGEGGEMATYNLNDPFERRQYADAMRQAGMSEQEIEALLEEFAGSEFLQDE